MKINEYNTIIWIISFPIMVFSNFPVWLKKNLTCLSKSEILRFCQAWILVKIQLKKISKTSSLNQLDCLLFFPVRHHDDHVLFWKRLPSQHCLKIGKSWN